MNILSKILRVIYPDQNICLQCGDNYLYSEIKGICDSCLEDIELLENYCPICGRELYKVASEGDLCSHCQNESYIFEAARSMGTYNGLLKKLLLEFKYNDITELKRPLVHLMYIALNCHYNSEKIDNIIPVPIHKKRLKQRGYNQAELLAEELSLYTGIPLSLSLLRIKDSPPLYNFAYKQRRTLLKDSFYVKKNCYEGQSLLLIDDIFTTGATANEIARVLKNTGGAVRVIILTIATAYTY